MQKHHYKIGDRVKVVSYPGDQEDSDEGIDGSPVGRVGVVTEVSPAYVYVDLGGALDIGIESIWPCLPAELEPVIE